ncbi:ATP-binding cassette subfamily B protein [Thermosporothrix hazakensis]|jgi:ATP-binding cassette subfamily B protein|uniref:ATP-binding cassette subfamily B protein n=2 Tax=Thermosporothrix TaxID=768650 RepID=A0A326U842_THEHA|nr:ABC transporter ATP-binding protein [Thermosporothrix hazakensis]PZW31906.1 ATP-binding cassette subfamily B protein [Thermosporothrix hazakensis]BBH91624.1 hypothetical protein KTC_63750 [Thermosporothrix sp. COM3]GCE49769.1 hypothetical protein KTH_46380 [Thermosporothrix hazakensis]
MKVRQGMIPPQRPGGGFAGGFAKGGFGGGKPKNVKATLRRLMGYLAPYRLHLLLVLLAAVLGATFAILGPKILGLATTAIFEGVLRGHIDFAAIARILVSLAVLYVFSALFTYLQQFLMAYVAQKTVYSLRRAVDEKLTRLPLRFFDSRPHGDILSRAVNDLDMISNTLQQSLIQLITSTVTIAGVIILMFTISWILALAILLTLPLSFFVMTAIARRSQRYFMGQQLTLGGLNSQVEEMYTGYKVVKAFGYEQEAVQRFARLNEKLYEQSWKAQFVSGIIMPSLMLVGNLGFTLVAVLGGVMIAQRAIAVGDVQAMIQYANQFTTPITQFANIANIIQAAIASAERVFELLDEPEELPDAPDAVEIHAPKGQVQFEHVRFGYSKEKILMHDINIDVSPGQTIAIVGPTGAGKTTLVNLLLRFYELNGGQICVDGIDITRLKRGNLRRLFGMVLQDTWLFHGTIQENIAYGRADATQEEIMEAARAAHADHFIKTLPEGYHTVLGQEASNISQGQKQLLTIARAILSKPSILLLDEATSDVDSRTETLIQNALSAFMRGRTSFVVAHRLSTIRNADLILVMEHGTIVEQGTHQQLLEKQGAYANLYNSQFLGRSSQGQ